MITLVSMKKVIILYGPTGVGKTSTSIKLAKILNGEIISADSMQVYKGMDIGTAKITQEEMEGIPHHLISIISPQEEWTVYDFVVKAKECINEIFAKNKTPILVGGTGLYIKALIENYDFNGADKDTEIRKKYQNLASEKGNEFVYSLLKEKCPERAEKLSENDTFRIVRALEILEIKEKNLNKPQISEKKPDYEYIIFALMKDREKLYKKINGRVTKMFKLGLKEEVKSLLDQNIDENCPALQGIGYKELIQYFHKELNLKQTKELIKKRTRNYAKRQITFLNSFTNVVKIPAGKNATKCILKTLKEDNNGTKSNWKFFKKCVSTFWRCCNV